MNGLFLQQGTESTECFKKMALRLDIRLPINGGSEVLDLIINDNYLEKPYEEREKALNADYDLPIEQGGEDFQGFHIISDGKEGLHCYRKYLPSYEYPTFIHNDGELCRRTGIVFLMDDPSQSIAFWKPKKNLVNTFIESDWEMVAQVQCKFNRYLNFNATAWHSRYPQWFGEYRQMRLIKVYFLP